MSKLFDTLKDFMNFGSGLSFVPKLTLTLVVILLGAFIISVLWIDPTPSNATRASNGGKVDSKFVENLRAAIEKGDVFTIKSTLINNENTKKLNHSHGIIDLHILPDFNVDGYVFDFAIMPDGNYYGQTVRYATLVKLLNPKRSPVAPEGQQEIDKISSIEGGNGFRSKINPAVASREDYRINTPIQLYAQQLVIGGQKDVMSKKEIDKVFSENSANRNNAIITYDTLLDIVK